MNNLHNIHPNISRVIEIAIAGNHPIAFAASRELIEQLGIDEIKEDIRTILFDFEDVPRERESFAYADIIVELTDFDMNEYWQCKDGRREPIESLLDRATDVEEKVQLKINKIDTCRALLGTAKNKLNLSINAIEKILSVANTIAKLDKSDKIEIQHVAEAIQYKSILKSEAIIL